MKKLIYLIVVIVALSLIVAGCGLLTAPPSEESELDTKAPSNCITIQSGELLASDGSVITTGYDEWGYNYQAHMFNGWYCDYLRGLPVEHCDVHLIMKWNDAWLSNKSCDDDLLLDRHYGLDSYIGSGAWLTNHMWGECWNIIGEWKYKAYYEGKWYYHVMTIEDVVDGHVIGHGATPNYENPTYKWEIITSESTYDYEGNLVVKTKYEGSNYGVVLTLSVTEEGKLEGTWSNPSQGEENTWEWIEGNATICEWDYFCKIVAAPADATLDADTAFWYNTDGTEIGPEIWGNFVIIQEVSNDPCIGEEGILYKSPAGPGFGIYGPETEE